MSPQAAARQLSAGPAAGDYQRHRPKRTLLYQIVERHYPAFVEYLAQAGKQLPGHVRQAFDDYLQCGRLEHGFLRLRCDTCHAEHFLGFSCKRRGFCPSCGARRMADGAAWLVLWCHNRAFERLGGIPAVLRVDKLGLPIASAVLATISRAKATPR